MTKPFVIALLPLAITAVQVQADEVYQLSDVVVTASRTAQTIDETLAPVTVISRKEIERSQATSVTELLNRAPGVQITYNGGPGSNTGVYIRGTKTAQTLILVDGHKINSASSGTASLEYLDPDQIERIEIVRGPRSSLYGADAVGGVINIITRTGTGKPQLTMKAGMGSRDTNELALNYSGNVDGTRFSLGSRLYETQGYDRTTNKKGSDWDDDGYRNKSLSGSLSKQLNNNIEIGINLFHAEGKAEYDNASGSTWEGYPTSYFEQSTINTHISLLVNDVWITKLDAGFSRDNRDDIGSKYPRNATNKRYSTSWINDISWSDNQQLTTGIDYSNEKVDSSSNYSESERYNAAVFAQNSSSFNSNDLQVGVRYDKNEAYGNKTTGNIAWGFDLPYDMRLITSYGTAFRAPTFGDLYGSNPDLKPEESKNTEIELRGKFSDFTHWSANVYQNNMKDMLDYNYDTQKTENISKARMRGIELSASTQLSGWEITAALSLLDPENRSGENSGKTLNRRATELFALDADKEFGHWTVGGTLRSQGATWNDPANKEEVSGFATVDLRTSVKLTPELKTQFKVVNLLNKEFTTTKGYVDEPRGAFISLTWTPNP